MTCNIAFFGSHSEAIPLLDLLVSKENVNLVCIVTKPYHGSGKGRIVKPTVISEWAKRNCIELFQPDKPDEHLAKILKKKEIHVILLMGYGCLLRDYILELPSQGIYNFHPSLLPKYRGTSPVETAIACGDRESGVTFMEIAPKMDAGDVIDIERFEIGANDYATNVYEKVSHASTVILERQLNSLVQNKIIMKKQDDTMATYTRKIVRQDAQIDFNLPAREIINRIHGFHDHVGTFTIHKDIVLNVGIVELHDRETVHDTVGQIISIDKQKIIVTTKKGLMAIYELQRPCRKMLGINDFANGYKLNVGDVFESSESNLIVSNEPFPYRRSTGK